MKTLLYRSISILLAIVLAVESCPAQTGLFRPAHVLTQPSNQQIFTEQAFMQRSLSAMNRLFRGPHRLTFWQEFLKSTLPLPLPVRALVSPPLSEFLSYHPDASEDELRLITEAAQFAEFRHRENRFPSGETYRDRAQELALTVAQAGQGAEAIAAAYYFIEPDNQTFWNDEHLALRARYPTLWQHAEQIQTLRRALAKMLSVPFDPKLPEDNKTPDYTIQKATDWTIQHADQLMAGDNANNSEEDLASLLSLTLAHKLHEVSTIDSVQNRADLEKMFREILLLYAPLADRCGLIELGERLRHEVWKRLLPHEFERVETEVEQASGFSRAEANEQMRRLREHTEALLSAIPDFKGALVRKRVKGAYKTWEKEQLEVVTHSQKVARGEKARPPTIEHQYDLNGMMIVVKDSEALEKLIAMDLEENLGTKENRTRLDVNWEKKPIRRLVEFGGKPVYRTVGLQYDHPTEPGKKIRVEVQMMTHDYYRDYYLFGTANSKYAQAHWMYKARLSLALLLNPKNPADTKRHEGQQFDQRDLMPLDLPLEHLVGPKGLARRVGAIRNSLKPYRLVLCPDNGNRYLKLPAHSIPADFLLHPDLHLENPKAYFVQRIQYAYGVPQRMAPRETTALEPFGAIRPGDILRASPHLLTPNAPACLPSSETSTDRKTFREKVATSHANLFLALLSSLDRNERMTKGNQYLRDTFGTIQNVTGKMDSNFQSDVLRPASQWLGLADEEDLIVALGSSGGGAGAERSDSPHAQLKRRFKEWYDQRFIEHTVEIERTEDDTITLRSKVDEAQVGITADEAALIIREGWPLLDVVQDPGKENTGLFTLGKPPDFSDEKLTDLITNLRGIRRRRGEKAPAEEGRRLEIHFALRQGSVGTDISRLLNRLSKLEIDVQAIKHDNQAHYFSLTALAPGELKGHPGQTPIHALQTLLHDLEEIEIEKPAELVEGQAKLSIQISYQTFKTVDVLDRIVTAIQAHGMKIARTNRVGTYRAEFHISVPIGNEPDLSKPFEDLKLFIDKNIIHPQIEEADKLKRKITLTSSITDVTGVMSHPRRLVAVQQAPASPATLLAIIRMLQDERNRLPDDISRELWPLEEGRIKDLEALAQGPEAGFTDIRLLARLRRAIRFLCRYEGDINGLDDRNYDWANTQSRGLREGQQRGAPYAIYPLGTLYRLILGSHITNTVTFIGACLRDVRRQGPSNVAAWVEDRLKEAKETNDPNTRAAIMKRLVKRFPPLDSEDSKLRHSGFSEKSWEYAAQDLSIPIDIKAYVRKEIELAIRNEFPLYGEELIQALGRMGPEGFVELLNEGSIDEVANSLAGREFNLRDALIVKPEDYEGSQVMFASDRLSNTIRWLLPLVMKQKPTYIPETTEQIYFSSRVDFLRTLTEQTVALSKTVVESGARIPILTAKAESGERQHDVDAEVLNTVQDFLNWMKRDENASILLELDPHHVALLQKLLEDLKSRLEPAETSSPPSQLSAVERKEARRSAIKWGVGTAVLSVIVEMLALKGNYSGDYALAYFAFGIVSSLVIGFFISNAAVKIAEQIHEEGHLRAAKGIYSDVSVVEVDTEDGKALIVYGKSTGENKSKPITDPVNRAAGPRASRWALVMGVVISVFSVLGASWFFQQASESPLSAEEVWVHIVITSVWAAFCVFGVALTRSGRRHLDADAPTTLSLAPILNRKPTYVLKPDTKNNLIVISLTTGEDAQERLQQLLSALRRRGWSWSEGSFPSVVSDPLTKTVELAVQRRPEQPDRNLRVLLDKVVEEASMPFQTSHDGHRRLLRIGMMQPLEWEHLLHILDLLGIRIRSISPYADGGQEVTLVGPEDEPNTKVTGHLNDTLSRELPQCSARVADFIPLRVNPGERMGHKGLHISNLGNPIGLLARITDTLKTSGMNIEKINQSSTGEKTDLFIESSANDEAALAHLAKGLRRIEVPPVEAMVPLNPDRRLYRLNFNLLDEPGALHRLSSLLASPTFNVNIDSIYSKPSGQRDGHAWFEFEVSAPADLNPLALKKAIEALSFPVEKGTKVGWTKVVQELEISPSKVSRATAREAYKVIRHKLEEFPGWTPEADGLENFVEDSTEPIGEIDIGYIEIIKNAMEIALIAHATASAPEVPNYGRGKTLWPPAKPQFRKAGDNVPYVIHPLIAAANILALGRRDAPAAPGALLHDTDEDAKKRVWKFLEDLLRNGDPKGLLPLYYKHYPDLRLQIEAASETYESTKFNLLRPDIEAATTEKLHDLIQTRIKRFPLKTSDDLRLMSRSADYRRYMDIMEERNSPILRAIKRLENEHNLRSANAPEVGRSTITKAIRYLVAPIVIGADLSDKLEKKEVKRYLEVMIGVTLEMEDPLPPYYEDDDKDQVAENIAEANQDTAKAAAGFLQWLAQPTHRAILSDLGEPTIQRFETRLRDLRDNLINDVAQSSSYNYDPRRARILSDGKNQNENTYEGILNAAIPELGHQPIHTLIQQKIEENGRAVWADAGIGYGLALLQGRMAFGEPLVTYGIDTTHWLEEHFLHFPRDVSAFPNELGKNAYESQNAYTFIHSLMENAVIPEPADLITAIYSMSYLEDPFSTILNLYYQLKSGGVFIGNVKSELVANLRDRLRQMGLKPDISENGFVFLRRPHRLETSG